MGVKADCKSDRETISYSAECLREYFPIVAPILVGNVLYPRLLRWEVDSAQGKIEEYDAQLKVALLVIDSCDDIQLHTHITIQSTHYTQRAYQ